MVEVRIDDDPLALDNHRWLAVPVREHLNVLLVDGEYKPEPFQSETDYLAQALSPDRLDAMGISAGRLARLGFPPVWPPEG